MAERWAVVAGLWSGKPQRFALLGPTDREVGVVDQHSRGQAGGLASVEDRGGDVGGEVGQPQNPRIVGSVELLVSREIGEFAVRAVP